MKFSQCLDLLHAGRLLRERDLLELCSDVEKILRTEPNVASVCSPVVVCGDIHGQYGDLLEILGTYGEPELASYCFLGDIVDRGPQSLECVQHLFFLKVNYPDKVTILRGNHETRTVSRTYGFYDEVLRKYGTASVWSAVMNVFDCLPLAGVLDSNFAYLVHGGLCPAVRQVPQDLQSVDRFKELDVENPVSAMLWSDPNDEPGAPKGYIPSPRGAGYLFGEDVVDEFLQSNNLSVVIRSHQLAMDGFKWSFGRKVLTVWSASNYCNRCGNEASSVLIDEEHRFTFVVHTHGRASARTPWQNSGSGAGTIFSSSPFGGHAHGKDHSPLNGHAPFGKPSASVKFFQ